MPKAYSSVVGVDLGRHALKAVHLQRRGARLAVTGYASRIIGDVAPDNADALAHHLKLLFRDVGTTAKNCVAAVSSPEALIRIIEQPTTPTNLLRDALRLNGLALLNQECHDFVLDCDQIPASTPVEIPGAAPAAPAQGGRSISRYLVGGLPRVEVGQVSAAFAKNRTSVDALQLAPICNYNAFEYSHADVFARESFVLVDIGHTETRVLVGAKRELVLARTIDYGGNNFLNAITSGDGIDVDSAIMLVEQNDPGMMEASRASLYALARELRSSIGFFEGQREEAISRVYFSGGLVRALMPLQILSDELEIPCNTWDPFQNCQVDLPKARLAAFDGERTHLNIACGAALELLLAA
jgi:Tfp pilus assembly PilM family ATPase